jgi:hypothetical protein
MRYRLMILAAFATLAILASPPRASAVTGDEATWIAWDGTGRDCPHHMLGILRGVCLRRQVEAVWGLGAGRWRYTASHWEGTLFDSREWRKARWYYTRSCSISAAGNRYDCTPL